MLPAYNEESVLGSVLDEVVAAFPDAEIIVVSDGSTDGTPQVARSFAPRVRCVHYKINRGKGYAVRQGMMAASGDIIAFSDSDLPFGTDGISQVISTLLGDPGLDIAIASKTRIERGLGYRFARTMARAAISAITGLHYEDTQAGLKAFRRRAARYIYSRTRIDGFASDIEVLFVAQKGGFRVVSVPLSVKGAFVRPSRFGFKQGVRLLEDVGRIRLGQY